MRTFVMWNGQNITEVAAFVGCVGDVTIFADKSVRLCTPKQELTFALGDRIVAAGLGFFTIRKRKG